MIGIGWRGQNSFWDFCDFGVFLAYFWGIFGVFEYATKIDLYLESGVPKKKKRSNVRSWFEGAKNLKNSKIGGNDLELT